MLKHINRFVSLILVCIFLFSGIPTVNARYYTDVSKSNLTSDEFDSIMYVSDNGIMVGYETGEFAPNAYLNRAQFVQTLFNYSGENYEFEPRETSFTDVIEGTWYYDAVCWATDNNIVQGTSETTFHPARNVTIAEALTFLYRYAQEYGFDTYCYFETAPVLSHRDYSSIADWAWDAMNWALVYNILNPAADTSPLNPNVYATRKVIALFLRNFDKEAVGIDDTKIFSFYNENIYFYGNYKQDNIFRISDSYYNLLCQNVKNYYGINSSTAKSLLNSFEHYRKSVWGGSCLGISITTLFDALGKLDFNMNTENKLHMSDLSDPVECADVRDGINYYQMASFVLQYFRLDYSGTPQRMKIGLANLASEVNRNGATVVEYRWHKENDNGEETVFGHAIIIKNMDDIGDGWYSLRIYDPNCGDTYDTIYVNENGVEFRNHTLSSFSYYPKQAINELDFIDLDGTYNTAINIETNSIESQDLTYNEVGEDYLAQKALIIVPAVDFTLTNAEGEYLHYSAEIIEGTMDVYHCKPIANGPHIAADLMLVVDESESFTYTPTNTEGQSFFVTSDSLYASITGTNMEAIYVDENKIDVYEKGIKEMSTYSMNQNVHFD